MEAGEYVKVAMREEAVTRRQLIMQARQFESPQQAAAIVEASAERWKGPLHVRMLEGYAKSVTLKNQDQGLGMPAGSLVALGPHMAGSPVYAVMEEAAVLIRHGARSIERVPLAPTDLPSPSGIVLFQYPLNTTDVHGVDIPVIGMQWLPAVGLRGEVGSEHAYDDKSRGIAVAWYTGLDDLPHARRLAPVFPPLSLVHVSYLPFNTEFSFATIQEDQLAPWNFLFAFWAFVQQEVVYSEVMMQPRGIRRRAEHEGRPQPGPLNVVRLRRAAAGVVVPSANPKHIEWAHRWIVSGHWRKQWYAKAQVRRQIWIYDYVKGPEDRPLVERKKVFNVAR